VLIGGAVFPLLGGIYYWFPKMTGRMLSEAWGRAHFWLAFISFNIAFFPMHFAGLAGMPRRVYTYQPEMGWDGYNLVSTLGALGFAASFVLLLWNVVTSLRSGDRAGDNPWDAPSLEWATASPPPHSNFLQLPTVAGRDPLWENPPDQPVVVGLRTDVRDVLVTYLLDAEPDHRTEFPTPTIWPLATALATSGMFIGSIFTPWAVPIGAVPMFIAMTGWFWPKHPGETGTQSWPIRHRTLPKPNEAPAGGTV
jgi:cytochrome c oxidase subunit 1